jgi:hypothetical protein
MQVGTSSVVLMSTSAEFLPLGDKPETVGQYLEAMGNLYSLARKLKTGMGETPLRSECLRF